MKYLRQRVAALTAATLLSGSIVRGDGQRLRALRGARRMQSRVPRWGRPSRARAAGHVRQRSRCRRLLPLSRRPLAERGGFERAGGANAGAGFRGGTVPRARVQPRPTRPRRQRCERRLCRARAVGSFPAARLRMASRSAGNAAEWSRDAYRRETACRSIRRGAERAACAAATSQRRLSCAAPCGSRCLPTTCDRTSGSLRARGHSRKNVGE